MKIRTVGGELFLAEGQTDRQDKANNRFSQFRIYNRYCFPRKGRDSSVGIATRYGLDGPGIESRLGGEIFRTCAEQPWGPPSLLYNVYRVHFPEVKLPGRGVYHHPLLAPRSKEE